MDTATLAPSVRAEMEAAAFSAILDSQTRFRFRISIRNCADGASMVSLALNFTPGDIEAYRTIESLAYSLLGCVSCTKPGSIWGSDSGSIGGHVALTEGSFVMNKSGCRKLTCKHIAARHNIGIGRL